MSKSPAALHRPKKDKQAMSHEQPQEVRPYDINVKRERPLPTPSPPARRTLSVLLSKIL